jgi:hypothetical protein
MNAYTRRKLLSAAGFALVCCVVLEIAVRVICTRDIDGNRWFGTLQLKPYHLPVLRTAELVRAYAAAPSRIMIYDPDLGWAPQPLHNEHNAQGFYSTSPTVDPKPVPGRLRIALFGASYTEGTFQTGWWRSLEKSLNDAGVQAEVFNFGCGGYATDQVFLRWRKEGAAFQPQIVVLGLTHHDADKNLNLFRWFAEPDTGIPFMKPRLLLKQDQLRLINVPTPRLEDLPGLVAHFGDWPLARYEGHYDPANFRETFWQHSALLALLHAQFDAPATPKPGALSPEAESDAERLTVGIIRQFKAEAQAAGSTFYIVHLPDETDLHALQDTGTYPFAKFLDEIKASATVIQPEYALLDATHGRNLDRYFHDSHYTADFNPVIGKAIADALLARPEVARFRKAQPK